MPSASAAHPPHEGWARPPLVLASWAGGKPNKPSTQRRKKSLSLSQLSLHQQQRSSSLSLSLSGFAPVRMLRAPATLVVKRQARHDDRPETSSQPQQPYPVSSPDFWDTPPGSPRRSETASSAPPSEAARSVGGTLDAKITWAVQARKHSERESRQASQQLAAVEDRRRREELVQTIRDREEASRQQRQPLTTVVASLRCEGAAPPRGFFGGGAVVDAPRGEAYREAPPGHAPEDGERAEGEALLVAVAVARTQGTTYDAKEALVQAELAVKAADKGLGEVHYKWQSISREREEAEYRERQRLRNERQAMGERRAKQVWLQVEEETRQKLEQIRLDEELKAQRLREQGEERLRQVAEQRHAEEREEAADKARRAEFAQRWQEKKLMEREERERELREEREATAILQAKEQADMMAAEKAATRRAHEAREAALARKRADLEQKRHHQQADKERREQETKEQFERMKEQQRLKEIVRKDMEAKAKAAAAEAKLQAGENERLLEAQAAAAKDEAARRSRVRNELERKEAEATLARVQHSEKLTKKLLKESRNLAAGFEQDARNREEEAKARVDADVRRKREIDFRRRQEEQQRQLESTKRHKAWQAAEVREKLRREAYEAANKKSLAEQERQRIAESNERELRRYEDEWRAHRVWKAQQYDADLARRRSRALEEKRERREAFNETVREWHETNDAQLEQVSAEQRADEARRAAFRQHVVTTKQQREVARREQLLEVEEAAAEHARLQALQAQKALHEALQKTWRSRGAEDLEPSEQLVHPEDAELLEA